MSLIIAVDAITFDDYMILKWIPRLKPESILPNRLQALGLVVPTEDGWDYTDAGMKVYQGWKQDE